MAPEAATASGGSNYLLPAESGFVPSDVPGLRKAAMLVMALGEELSSILFKSLSDTNVQRLTDEITRLGRVPAVQLKQVMTEFYGLLETQEFVIKGGDDYALKLLTEAFGPAKAEEMLNQTRKLRERSAGDLAMLQKMEPQQLSKFLENEHPQTVALVLAHLDAQRGSVVLMNLGPEMRVEAVRRLAEMRQFSPEVAQKVALVLHRRMSSLGTTGRKSYAGFKAVAELLNRLDQNESKGILEKIEQNEPKVAIQIRTLMFTFDDLLTVPQNSVRDIVAAADKKTLALALKGAKENVRAHIFSVMSSRAVEMLREDMEVMGPVRGREVNAAQQELLALANQLEADGKIVLRLDPEDDAAL
jgi:flagellar motor switch protein FliG